METIRGKASRDMSTSEFRQRITGYDGILLDVGTGDGRYVHTVARQQPGTFVIGVDACRENLREYSRSDRHNMLFIIAEAQDLPAELNGMVSQIAINFPWGSLLQSLLDADPALMQTLARVARPSAALEIRVNAGALSETGSTLEMGAECVHDQLLRSGWAVCTPQPLDAASLRQLPSTWARRLAFGRDPRAVQINGQLARS